MEIDSNASEFDFNSVSIKCSWNVMKNAVRDAFSFVQFQKDEVGDINANDMLIPESCVFMCQPENSDESLTFDLVSSDNSFVFKQIYIISEASFIEVYGLFGEYHKTVIGELLEEVDGTQAFCCLLDNLKWNQIKLKFVGLKGAKEMWFFGGRIWFDHDTDTRPSTSLINMERVDSRLAEGNFQLSPSADSLKKLVTEYVSRNGAPSPGCFDSVAKNFASMQRQTSQQGPSTSRSFASPTQTLEFWQSYVDSSMKSMENRIMDNLSEKIRELELRQNKRLDHILKLLENCVPPLNNNQ